MTKRQMMWLGGAAVFCAGAAVAQYPIIDMMAGRVVEKVQGSSCEQLWEGRGKPKSEREQELIRLLRSDPGARQEFINRIAAPVANKMFECGMIP
ncbi:MAG TPA: hypothetical protein PLE54_02095 [Burkholderiaceae bacterium]|nr:hypothetical protein [Burkholderiaceae bacterium]HQR69368.1 hypothetical protein [Burkholderiaceae bacterium]